MQTVEEPRGGEQEELKRREVTEYVNQVISCANWHLRMKAKLCDIPEGLREGDYSVQFQFKLPAQLPSSLYFTDPSHEKKPTARNRYEIKAVIVGTDCGTVQF